MHISTKTLLAMAAVGAVAYGVHRFDKKRKAEEHRRRTIEKKNQQKAA